MIEKGPTIADPAEKKKLALEAALLAKNEYSMLRLAVAHIVLAHGSKIGDMARYRSANLMGLMYETITHGR